jgi:hypothetical protein
MPGALDPARIQDPAHASATIKGFQVMRMICEQQRLMLETGAAGEVPFVNWLFRLAA